MKISHYLWIAALVLGAIGILGKYDLVVIKGVSKYSFELLLAGYIALIIARFFKK